MKVNKYIIGMFVATATLLYRATPTMKEIYTMAQQWGDIRHRYNRFPFLPQDMRVLMWKSYARNLRKLLQLIYQQH